MHDVPVDVLRQYIEKNPEVFAAVVAFAAILGGLLGSVIGAKIQANGGRDQAAAAREAAKIAAEAQRVAALWTVRQLRVAELVRTAGALHQQCNTHWSTDDEELADRIGTTSSELALLWAEVRLVATDEVVVAAGRLAAAMMTLEGITVQYATVRRARMELLRLGPEGGTGEASALLNLLVEHESDAEDRANRLSALVPALHRRYVEHIVHHSHRSDTQLTDLYELASQDCSANRNTLVVATREMLKSEDDVVPAVPEQRRRGWRRAA